MSKRLELEYTNVKTVEWGGETKLEGDRLVVNKEDLFSRIDTSLYETADIILARPGDKVRILGLADYVQPRVKTDRPEISFPGFLGKLAPVGDGRTTALKGVLVTSLNPLKYDVKTLLDMSGPLAERSMISRHNHIVLDFRPAEGTTPYAFCQAQQRAALTLAVYLASLAIGRKPDSTKVYEMTPVGPGPDGKPLPKVAYLTSQWSSHDIQQFFYYGQSGIGTLPMVVHPNDILDGAFLYCYSMSAHLYNYQEEATIKELYARHGKDIEFVGMVLTCGKTELVPKEASSMMAVSVAKEYLGADITINTKFGKGHTQLEQLLFHTWSDKLGMPAVTIMPVVSNEKPADLLVAADPALDAVVHSYGNQRIEYPYCETLIGTHDIPALMAYDLHGPFTMPSSHICGGGATTGSNYMTEDLDLPTEGWRVSAL